jgi:hypothetical protein
VDTRKAATKWLIEHNHHWCHLVDGQDGEVPKPEDANSLNALLVEVEMDEWERGYDQAAREILEEVKAVDMRSYLRLLTKYPKWRDLMKERAGGPW